MSKKAIVLEKNTEVLFNEVKGLMQQKEPKTRLYDNDVVYKALQFYKENKGGK